MKHLMVSRKIPFLRHEQLTPVSDAHLSLAYEIHLAVVKQSNKAKTPFSPSRRPTRWKLAHEVALPEIVYKASSCIDSRQNTLHPMQSLVWGPYPPCKMLAWRLSIHNICLVQDGAGRKPSGQEQSHASAMNLALLWQRQSDTETAALSPG